MHPFSPKAAPMVPPTITTTTTTTIMTTITLTAIPNIPICNALHSLHPLPFLRLLAWLSPAFPTGSYSYSHGLEWAVGEGSVHDRPSLVDWLAADLRYGSGRNEAIFFRETWSAAMRGDRFRLLEIAELAAAFRGTSEFALESAQQASACHSTLSRGWRDPPFDEISET